MSTVIDPVRVRPSPTSAAAPGAPGAPPTTASTVAVTFESWLAAESEGPLTEWVHGEVIVHMSASVLHQRLVSFLDRFLGLFVSLRGLGEVLIAPAAMRASPDGPGREPDLMFVAAGRRAIITDALVDGPPDLVVEVVSDDSVARDRDEKYSEYEAAGIREYWIIDPRPNRRRADFYVRGEDGRYQPVPVGLDGRYRSTAITGLWLDVRWLWAETPDAAAAIRETAGSL